MKNAFDTWEYRKLIEELARGNVNQRVPNSQPEHASILIETMFKNAQGDVRIFTGSLSSSVYDHSELVEEACRFLSRPGTRLRILVQKPQSTAWLKEHPLLKAVTEKGCKHLDLRQANGSYASDDARHFATMDDRGFRFELDHGSTKAVANFNEPPVAVELNHAFDRAFGLGKYLALNI